MWSHAPSLKCHISSSKGEKKKKTRTIHQPGSTVTHQRFRRAQNKGHANTKGFTKCSHIWLSVHHLQSSPTNHNIWDKHNLEKNFSIKVYQFLNLSPQFFNQSQLKKILNPNFSFKVFFLIWWLLNVIWSSSSSEKVIFSFCKHDYPLILLNLNYI